MTIETTLTRVLEIRFIDARALTTEAKVNLNIDGYASRKQEQEIMKEAIRIFIDRPEQDQQEMKVLREKMDVVVKAIYQAPAPGNDETSVAEDSLYDVKKRSSSLSSQSSHTADLSDVDSMDSTMTGSSTSRRRRRRGIFRLKKRVVVSQ